MDDSESSSEERSERNKHYENEQHFSKQNWVEIQNKNNNGKQKRATRTDSIIEQKTKGITTTKIITGTERMTDVIFL